MDTTKKMSRQRKWQLLRKEAGLCILCSKPREKYSNHCDPCHDKQLAYMRARGGFKPWVKGGRGRPPENA